MPRVIFLVAMGTANPAALSTSLPRLQNVDAVGGNFRARNKTTAYLPPSPGTGAFGASKIHKVRFPRWDFALLEARLDAVVVLVALAGAAPLRAGGTAGSLR